MTAGDLKVPLGSDGSTSNRRSRSRSRRSHVNAIADVVVIGGGIVGSAVAGELARLGAAVTLVERGPIAAGASGRNHGLLFRPEDPVLDPLFRASLARYRELATTAELDLGLDAAPVGLLIVVADEAGWAAGERE